MQEEGLGIQSQINAVTNYVNGNGIIATYSEVETSTRKKKRIEIYKAIEYAKANNAILVVAKLIDLHVMYHLQVLYIMVILILCVVIIHLLIN
jgi:DNA invertase Pin-like site-specific DNA recombinase